MKPYLFIRTFIQMMGIIVIASLAAESHAQSDIKGGPTADPAEQRQLDALFATTRAADSAVQAGPDAGYQHRLIALELGNELETFIAAHSNSTLNASVHFWLADQAERHADYSDALDHYKNAWLASKGLDDNVAREAGWRAAAKLARLLALTGRMDELDALDKDVQSYTGGQMGQPDWRWAMEMRIWARKHPEESYKCG
ncbi:MAG TPA: hypothetical protein VL527_19110, partial [Dongiaceae bacterium]|nr:hypothetical protein [Dongiaceae bacterium]